MLSGIVVFSLITFCVVTMCYYTRLVSSSLRKPSPEWPPGSTDQEPWYAAGNVRSPSEPGARRIALPLLVSLEFSTDQAQQPWVERPAPLSLLTIFAALFPAMILNPPLIHFPRSAHRYCAWKDQRLDPSTASAGLPWGSKRKGLVLSTSRRLMVRPFEVIYETSDCGRQFGPGGAHRRTPALTGRAGKAD
jgi:hypothetical protein